MGAKPVPGRTARGDQVEDSHPASNSPDVTLKTPDLARIGRNSRESRLRESVLRPLELLGRRRTTVANSSRIRLLHYAGPLCN